MVQGNLKRNDWDHQTGGRLDSKNPWKFSKSVRYRKTRQKFAVSAVAPLLGRAGASRKKLWYLQIYTTCCKFTGLRTEPVHPTICFGWSQRTAIVHLLLARNHGGVHWEIMGVCIEKSWGCALRNQRGLHSRKSTHTLTTSLNPCLLSTWSSNYFDSFLIQPTFCQNLKP